MVAGLFALICARITTRYRLGPHRGNYGHYELHSHE